MNILFVASVFMLSGTSIVPKKLFQGSVPKGTKTVGSMLTVAFVGLFLFF